jgi:hypothetical protein
VVMVFAKNNAASLAGLVKKLDKLVADKKDSKLTPVVNIMAEEDAAEKAKEEITKFAETNEVKNVSLSVTDEKSAKNFKINPEADVTVMVYRDKKITANHAVEAGKLDDKAIEAIVADAEKAAAE